MTKEELKLALYWRCVLRGIVKRSLLTQNGHHLQYTLRRMANWWFKKYPVKQILSQMRFCIDDVQQIIWQFKKPAPNRCVNKL
jgi:uncharacterized protein YqcC (DUF446 family)